MKTFFRICAVIVFFLHARPGLAQSPELTTKSGIIFNAENLLRSGYFKPGIKFTASALWEINPYMKLGPEAGIFSISQENWIPAGIAVQSRFSQKTPLFLNTSLGYSLSSRTGEKGMDWGGIYLKSGLGTIIPLSPKINLTFDVQYYLQERKYRTFIYSFIESEMQHLMEINAGVSFKL